VLEPGRWRARILGAERELCCAGCEAVARTIAEAGYERYYETREPPQPGGSAAPLAASLPPAAIYDDPDAQRQFAARRGEHLREATLILERIRCAACLWLSERWLRGQPGILRADVNYATRRAHVTWDARVTRLSAVIEAIRAIGYDAMPHDPRRQQELDRGERRRALWRLFVAGFGAMQVMMYAFPAYIAGGDGTLSAEAERLMRWASLVLTTPVIAFACGPFFYGAWQELRLRRIGLDTPIALGIAGGFAASAWATLTDGGEVYFDSIAMLVFLLLAARYVELAARQRAARELDRLSRWMPSFALRLRDPGDAASVERIGSGALRAGDRVLVPAGDCVPADGVVERGASSADESLLTGESGPVAKGEGAALIGGSLNLEQPLVMRVERAGAETLAAAIARLVERASAARPRVVAAADRIAHALTWVVLAVAAAAWLAWLQVAPERALWVAVAVLVATCPCALALAAPIALTAAAARLLERGVALTRSSALEALARATDVVLDKTGTLTFGRFALRRAQLLGELDEPHCLALARSLEAGSRHPIARAFAGEGARVPVSELANYPGHGIEAHAGGGRVRIGTEAFCRELAGSPPPPHDTPHAAARTMVYLAREDGWLAAFVLEDLLREDAARLADTLGREGVRLHLVSGDRAEVVADVARRLGIVDFAGGASPQAKHAYVARLQAEGRVVAMIGDGLNDAPVLARADVSIAMGGGADAAQLQADLVLVGERLGAVLEARAIARRAMRIVRQNFGWALAYNAAALPLAASGFIGPWEAAIGMAASSFIVVLNAMRLGAGARETGTWKASPSSYRSQSA
jgi:Cu2+-exporting ATPase